MNCLMLCKALYSAATPFNVLDHLLRNGSVVSRGWMQGLRRLFIQVVSEDLGHKLENVDLSMLGTAKKVTISKDDTIILGGGGEASAIADRCDQIREAMENTKSDYDREKLQERLAKLSGGVAMLKIGGASEVEVGEKKDRVEDALNATKAAVEEGIVPGGGCALLYASRGLDALKEKCANFDQQVVADIFA